MFKSLSGLLILFWMGLAKSVPETQARIGIIGGGVGGATAAFVLTEIALEKNLNIEIDVYEPNQVGGRLATLNFSGYEFEIGGSIIHRDNKYMTHFVKKLGLSRYNTPACMESRLAGFFDGYQFVFIESHNSVWTFLKFWWRYGLELLTLIKKFVMPILSHFSSVYEIQSKEGTFDDIHHFLSSLDDSFPPLLTLSLSDLLFSKGFTNNFIDEVVFIATNVNYNQDSDIHAFVGAVAMAGAGDDLWSVEGGNKQIPERLLANSDVNLIKNAVNTVHLLPTKKYALFADDTARLYDYVIIATPFGANLKNNITFQGFPSHIEMPSVAYQKTVATLVHGELNNTYFNCESHAHVPGEIFSVNKSLFFNSVSVLRPVTPDCSYDGKVYKIFSKNILTDDELGILFSSYDAIAVTEWLAYPLYDTKHRDLKFVLYDNLFYVNAVEWAASAMEMSAIGGVNAALHVAKRLQTKHPNL